MTKQESRSDDSIRIPLGPLKTMGRRAALSGGVSLAAALQATVVAGAALIEFLVAAFVWWLSDLAHGIHWIVGLPVRIVAFVFGAYALFGLLYAAFQLVVLLAMSCWLLARIALGKRID